jgi:hypothetical protein
LGDIVLAGATSGTCSLHPADVAGSTVITLPSTSGTMALSGGAGSFTTLDASGVATFSAGSASAPAITTTGDTNTGIFFPSADVIAFTDGGAESMRIDANKNLLIGNTTATDSSGIGFKYLASATAPSVALVGSASTNGTGTGFQMYSTGAGAYRFYVGYGGTVNATSTSISAISDERLKENITDLDLGLAEVLALQPRRYDWKEGKGQDKKNAVGFIAQEFEQVLPNSVGSSKAGDDGIEYKNINYEELIPALVNAIKELKAEIDLLKGVA